MTDQWDDKRIGDEALALANKILHGVHPTVVDTAIVIRDFGRRVRDEQREADAKKCDEIADYHRAQAEDWWENHVVCAESCAAAIRGESELKREGELK